MLNKLQTCHTKLFFTCLLVILLLFRQNVLGQVTLPHYDDINYTAGSSLQTQAGWTSLNSGDDISIVAGNLTYTGLAPSAGNSFTFGASGIDTYKAFTSQTTAGTTVYYSFLLSVISVGSLNSTGGYFTGFIQGISTNYGATVWTRLNGSGYDIGINGRTAAANTVWYGGLTVGTTYFIVVSYELVSGTNNDLVNLWVNPVPGVPQPSATLTNTTGSSGDLSNVAAILIRQDAASATPNIQMDELRIGTSWADVSPAPPCSVPPAITTTFAPAICAGEILSLAVTATGDAPLTYTWTGVGTISDTHIYNPTVSNASGNYTVTVENACGTASTEIVTSINSLPGVSVSPSSTIITSGDTVTLTASGADTYAWSTTETTQSISVSPLATTNYTVVGINVVSGCSNTAVAQVNICGTALTITNTFASVICSGETLSLSVNTAGGLPTSYAWTGAGTITDSNTANATVSGAVGNYTIIVSNACSTASAEVTTTINPTPSLSISASGTLIVPGQSAILTASGASTYSWSTTETTQSISVFPIITSNYTVIGTDNACSASATISIGVKNIISLNAVCLPYIQDFNTLASTGVSSVLPIGWAFSTNNGIMTYTANTGSSATSGIYSYAAASTTDMAFGSLMSNATEPIYLGATFVNNTGTTISALEIGYYGEEWRLAVASRTDALNFAYNLSASSLTAGSAWISVSDLNFSTPNTTIATGAVNGNFAANRTLLTTTITGLSINNGDSFWIRWNDVNISGNDDGLAIDDFTLIPRSDVPTATISANGFCSDENLILNAAVTATVNTYSWNGPNGFTSNVQNPVIPNVNTAATGDYTLTVSDTYCSFSTSTFIAIYITPTINITGGGIVAAGQTATLMASGADTYTWSNGSNASSITVNSTSNYTLTGTSSDGCVSTATAEVVVNTQNCGSIFSEACTSALATCFNFTSNTSPAYTVEVHVYPTSVVPTTTNCTTYYSYDIAYDYCVSFTGGNPMDYNLGMNVYFNCTGGTGSAPIAQTNLGLITVNTTSCGLTENGARTYSAPYGVAPNYYPSCDTVDLFDVGCTSVDIQFFGGVNSTVNCMLPAPLPITLVSFQSFVENNSVILKWVTATEKNCDYFVVERSADGEHWDEIERLKGSGNSSVTKTYYVTDDRPLFGVAYYRLKQIDYNGGYNYSPIISANFTVRETNDFVIYPVPTNGALNIATSQLNTQITLLNSSGEIMKVPSTIEKTALELDVRNLPAGVYTLILINSYGTKTQRIVIMH